MQKKIAIINSDNQNIISSIQNHFKSVNFDVISESDDISDYDIIILTGYSTKIPKRIDFDTQIVLNIYPAILPFFQCENPIKESFLSDMKLSGVTAHQPQKDNFTGKILMQYPVLKGNSVHFDEFIKEINLLCEHIYPSVIEAVINDKIFDFDDLFTPKCHGGCSNGCGGCSKVEKSRA